MKITKAKNEKSSAIGAELGLANGKFEALAGIQNVKTEATSATTDSRTTSSGTGFVLEGAILNAQKQPKFGGGFKYSPGSEKDDTSTTTTSAITLSGMMAIYF